MQLSHTVQRELRTRVLTRTVLRMGGKSKSSQETFLKQTRAPTFLPLSPSNCPAPDRERPLQELPH